MVDPLGVHRPLLFLKVWCFCIHAVLQGWNWVRGFNCLLYFNIRSYWNHAWNSLGCNGGLVSDARGSFLGKFTDVDTSRLGTWSSLLVRVAVGHQDCTHGVLADNNMALLLSSKYIFRHLRLELEPLLPPVICRVLLWIRLLLYYLFLQITLLILFQLVVWDLLMRIFGLYVIEICVHCFSRRSRSLDFYELGVQINLGRLQNMFVLCRLPFLLSFVLALYGAGLLFDELLNTLTTFALVLPTFTEVVDMCQIIVDNAAFRRLTLAREAVVRLEEARKISFRPFVYKVDIHHLWRSIFFQLESLFSGLIRGSWHHWGEVARLADLKGSFNSCFCGRSLLDFHSTAASSIRDLLWAGRREVQVCLRTLHFE